MSGRDHLNPQLFDDDEYYLPAPTGPRIEEDSFADPWARWDSGMSGYTTAHDMEGVWVPNALPEPVAEEAWMSERVSHEEFIPMERVGSYQKDVNEYAVQHQLEHANPLALGADPEVGAVKSGDKEEFVVIDGNHRLNAALRRGMLFHPATVYRGEES